MRAALSTLAVLAVGAALGAGGYAVLRHRAHAPDPYGLPIVCKGETCWQGGERVHAPNENAPCLPDSNAYWAPLVLDRNQFGTPAGPAPSAIVCAGSE